MVRRYYNLPSLTALAAFEASARHMSMKAAAAELNVTPGAVSRQIKALEDEIGVPVFARDAGGVRLTAEGEALYAVLARGFSEASETFHRIRTGNRQTSVTLACTNAFASMWLMRHMGVFWRQHPEIVVNHLISDDAARYRRADVDLRVRYGSGAWPDETAELLFEERIFPVCGPRYAQEHETMGLDETASHQFLHVEGADPEWTDWEEFLRRAGIKHGPLLGRRFNNFGVLLQATQDDQGIALGWERLIGPLLKQGKLVPFSDLAIDAPGAYYLTSNENRALSPAAESLRTWLLETARKDSSKTGKAKGRARPGGASTTAGRARRRS